MALSRIGPLERGDALFLDFDGTLVAIAERPSDVRVEEETRLTLERLQSYLGGAVAIVTGREIATVDQLLAPLVLPVAGVHGLELRMPDGAIARAPTPACEVEAANTRVAEFAASSPGLIAERKTFGVALHFRGNPEEGARCVAFAQNLAAELPSLRVQMGKMVVELRASGADKGEAIRRFMTEQAFAGRRPVFAGDDVTDEDGFAAVNELGGITIKIGDQPTAAVHRCADTESFLTWLNQQGHQL